MLWSNPLRGCLLWGYQCLLTQKMEGPMKFVCIRKSLGCKQNWTLRYNMDLLQLMPWETFMQRKFLKYSRAVWKSIWLAVDDSTHPSHARMDLTREIRSKGENIKTETFLDYLVRQLTVYAVGAIGLFLILKDFLIGKSGPILWSLSMLARPVFSIRKNARVEACHLI